MKNTITAETIRAEYEHVNYYHPNKKFLGHLSEYLNERLPEGKTVEFWTGKEKIQLIDHMTFVPTGRCRYDDAIFLQFTVTGPRGGKKKELHTVGPSHLLWLIKRDLELKGDELFNTMKEKLY